MIQRIQTVYLLLAAAVLVVCLSLPVGVFVSDGMTSGMKMYNLIIVENAVFHTYNHNACALFFALLASCALSLLAIFKYKNRPFQARMCVMADVLIVVWYLMYAFYAWSLQKSYGVPFSVSWTVVLPFVAFVLDIMARRAVMRDERLVKAADRIR